MQFKLDSNNIKIAIIDDGKEKHQSFELRLDMNKEFTDNFSNSLTIYSYGSDFDDVINNFYIGLDKFKESINSLETYLPKRNNQCKN